MRYAISLFHTVFLGVMYGCGMQSAGPSGVPQRAGDVILITLDTTRADALGCYGAPGGVSPHADALAAGGVLFERCISTSGITPVAHASILSGLEPRRHGLRVFRGESGFRIDAEVPTLATVLRSAGYHTVAVHSAFPVSGAFGFERGFDVFLSVDDDFAERMVVAEQQRDALWREGFQRRSDETIDLAVRALYEIDEAVFMWVHLFDVHDDDLLPPADFVHPVDAQVPTRDALYARELRYQDQQLGRLMAALRDLGRYEGATIALVADHGEGLSDGVLRHGWSNHALLYEEQLHVPLILRAPGLPAGRRVPSQVRITDLFPTLLQLLEIDPPVATDGETLVPCFDQPSASRVAFAEHLGGYETPAPALLRVRPHDDFVYSISDGTWKLIYRPAHSARSELFLLSQDPGEERNLLHERPQQVERLLAQLAARAPWVDRPFDPAPHDPAPQVTRALLSLGYGSDQSRTVLEPDWDWVCPHDGARSAQAGPCPHCGAARVLLASGQPAIAQE